VQIGGRVGQRDTPEGGAHDRGTGLVGETPTRPHTDGTDRPVGRRERLTRRSETDQPPSAAARVGRGGIRALGPRGWTTSTRVASAFKGQGGVSFVCTAAHPGHSSGPAEATTCPAWGSQPDPGARQTEACALRHPCTAEAAPQPKPRGRHALPPRRASPLRFSNDQDRRDDLGHAPFRQRWLRFRVAETRHAADPVLESGER
jgi:hypothetical protein